MARHHQAKRSTESPRRNTLIGKHVKALREARGWGVEELIARSGVSNVKMIEAGRRFPRPEQQSKLAVALDVPVWRLYTGKSVHEGTPKALQEFLEQTPAGRSASPEEIDYLIALPLMLGRHLTFDGYWKALEMLRLSVPDMSARAADVVDDED